MIPATVAPERDRANVTLFPRQRFCTHHDPNGIEAFGWLASRDAVISGDERERDVIRNAPCRNYRVLTRKCRHGAGQSFQKGHRENQKGPLTVKSDGKGPIPQSSKEHGKFESVPRDRKDWYD
jgi:hypothetical protein